MVIYNRHTGVKRLYTVKHLDNPLMGLSHVTTTQNPNTFSRPYISDGRSSGKQYILCLFGKRTGEVWGRGRRVVRRIPLPFVVLSPYRYHLHKTNEKW